MFSVTVCRQSAFSALEIGQLVPEKIFEEGRGGHLGHVTQMPRTNFGSSYPAIEAPHKI